MIRLMNAVGTGRQENHALTKLLNLQSGIKAFHELRPIMNWETTRGEFHRKIDKQGEMMEKYPDRLIVDVSIFNSGVVSRYLSKYQSMRMIVLKGDKKETVSSLVVEQHGHNYFQKGEESEHKWFKAFPTYNKNWSKIKCLGRYYDDYYKRMRVLRNKYPERVLWINTKELNNKEGVKKILDFCGIKGE